MSIFCSLLIDVSHLYLLYLFLPNCFSVSVILLVKHFVSVENGVKNWIYCCRQGTREKLKKKRAWSAVFFFFWHPSPPHFFLHFSLCLQMKHLSCLSDSVSFVGALRSCSNVMSCQPSSSLQSYLERERGEQDGRGEGGKKTAVAVSS